MTDLLQPRWTIAFLLGFILWHVTLIGLYGLLSIGCAFGWDRTIERAALLALWVANLAALAALLWFVSRARRRARTQGETARFVGFVAFGATLWSLAAAVGLGLPIFGASPCV